MNAVWTWVKAHKFWTMVIVIVVLSVIGQMGNTEDEMFGLTGSGSSRTSNYDPAPVGYDCRGNLASQLRTSSALIEANYSSNYLTSQLLDLQADYLANGC